MSVERLEKGNFDPNISVLASSKLFERDVCFFIHIFLQLITAASLWRIRLLMAGTELERYWSVCACLELNDDNFFLEHLQDEVFFRMVRFNFVQLKSYHYKVRAPIWWGEGFSLLRRRNEANGLQSGDTVLHLLLE